MSRYEVADYNNITKILILNSSNPSTYGDEMLRRLFKLKQNVFCISNFSNIFFAQNSIKLRIIEVKIRWYMTQFFKELQVR